ncbi:tumor necrosis factor receptor superfamily member 6B-like [Pempheris klunzingeri]|uniref:tumor necrosis factor receptor superfamily member 6B-like n=1 Tax=Pempheris klunzingeri TaxID=3127111 RepID=UPI00397E9A70
MHIINMLFLPVLLLFSGVPRCVSAVESAPTYEHTDPVSGETLTCDKCPPGTHMAAHCTATTPTKCAPCSDDHFTEFWNYLSRCLYCSNFCFENQEVERECSPVSNRVCRCQEGFYLTSDFCMKHSQCKPGYGVQTKGTPERDTVCEECADGSFSSSLSALDVCVNHRKCPSGQIELLPGSLHTDTVCGTCADKGEALRTLLSGFFSMHKIRVAKMKKIVTRYMHKSGQERRTRGTTVRKQRGPLLDQMRAWLALATVEQLTKVPQMLRDNHLTSMVEKLRRRLSEIEQQNPNCNLTVV